MHRHGHLSIVGLAIVIAHAQQEGVLAGFSALSVVSAGEVLVDGTEVVEQLGNGVVATARTVAMIATGPVGLDATEVLALAAAAAVQVVAHRGALRQVDLAKGHGAHGNHEAHVISPWIGARRRAWPARMVTPQTRTASASSPPMAAGRCRRGATTSRPVDLEAFHKAGPRDGDHERAGHDPGVETRGRHHSLGDHRTASRSRGRLR
ncbi:MAG: hypothetical protein DRI90_15705 [Deltaproteobacteria bacterium]|nr:MAG: hypothetical protein DRI90_15705 [Deltaproteobacteria bacterium]